MCRRSCRLRVDKWLKDFPQNLHWWGFTPVWVCSCRLHDDEREKDLSQNLHWWDLMPVPVTLRFFSFLCFLFSFIVSASFDWLFLCTVWGSIPHMPNNSIKGSILFSCLVLIAIKMKQLIWCEQPKNLQIQLRLFFQLQGSFPLS